MVHKLIAIQVQTVLRRQIIGKFFEVKTIYWLEKYTFLGQTKVLHQIIGN